MVPNMLRGLAHAPAALRAYFGIADGLGTGALRPALREQIALAVAGVNDCTYCAAAHAAIGGGLKLEPGEIRRNLGGGASDPRTAAALDFARALVEKRGHVSDDELRAVRDAGFDDGAVAEIVGHVALNTFTNYFNSVARTDLDFPPAPDACDSCAA